MSISSTPARPETPAPDPDAGSAGMTWLAIACVLALLAAVFLLPVSAPRAANADDPATASTPPPPADAANFGGATPTEKFVQSFQQQVSQQLQSALAQSNEAQEARLRDFEKQQKELGEQVQAMGQAVALTRSAGPADKSALAGAAASAADFAAVAPPRVNARRPLGAETGSESGTDFLAGALPGAWGGTDPGISPGRAWDRPMSDDHVATGTAPLATGRSRPGDPNVAPHGFIEGRLLNGVVAIQGGADRDSIVALSGSYQSANGFTSDLDGCLALVQGKPEIATGRIDFKLSRLTCNFPDGASRTWDASGWLVDADGIRGVRATIVDNTARKAAVAAAGGAVGGLGQRLSQQQYQVNSGPGGFGSSTTFTGSPASDALGGAASGAANALGQSINDYYNLYTPSLQVGGGTRVTVVLANDLRLPSSGKELSPTHVAAP